MHHGRAVPKGAALFRMLIDRIADMHWFSLGRSGRVAAAATGESR